MLDATIEALDILTVAHRSAEEDRQGAAWERDLACDILFNARRHLRRSIEVYLTGKERT